MSRKNQRNTWIPTNPAGIPVGIDTRQTARSEEHQHSHNIVKCQRLLMRKRYVSKLSSTPSRRSPARAFKGMGQDFRKDRRHAQALSRKKAFPTVPGLISLNCLALSEKQKGWARAKPPILKKAWTWRFTEWIFSRIPKRNMINNSHEQELLKTSEQAYLLTGAMLCSLILNNLRGYKGR